MTWVYIAGYCVAIGSVQWWLLIQIRNLNQRLGYLRASMDVQDAVFKPWIDDPDAVHDGFVQYERAWSRFVALNPQAQPIRITTRS